MAIDLIRYDLLVQEALRGVVRKVLSDVAQGGLLGEHHFNITFKTHAPGVQLSSRMRKEYPDEMTIILQHQFWGLKVTDQGFEVGLSFQKVPETLIIPYQALTGFYDPSVPFGLKFVESEPGANDADGPFDQVSQNAETSNGGSATPADAAKPQTGTGLGTGLGLFPVKTPDQAAEAAQSDDPKVVSIDAFRKKP
jgi:hypothetical protein